MDQAIPALMLTVEEAGTALRIGRTRMFALIGSGEIRSVKVGRSRRIPVEALTEYKRRLEAQAAQAAA